MAVRGGFRALIDDILAPLGPITSKRFFGLDGVKAGNVMLGFVLDDKLYLRAAAQEQPAYTAEGGKPYSFTMNGERIVTTYYSLPDRLYDDPDELVAWAKQAYAAAQEAPSFKARKAKHERRAAKVVMRASVKTMKPAMKKGPKR